jgi:hypothetical protein
LRRKFSRPKPKEEAPTPEAIERATSLVEDSLRNGQYTTLISPSETSRNILGRLEVAPDRNYSLSRITIPERTQNLRDFAEMLTHSSLGEEGPVVKILNYMKDTAANLKNQQFVWKVYNILSNRVVAY